MVKIQLDLINQIFAKTRLSREEAKKFVSTLVDWQINTVAQIIDHVETSSYREGLADGQDSGYE